MCETSNNDCVDNHGLGCNQNVWIGTFGCTQNVWFENHACIQKFESVLIGTPEMFELCHECIQKRSNRHLDAPRMFDVRMNAFKNVWIGIRGCTFWLENHERILNQNAWFGSHMPGCTQNAWPENHVCVLKFFDSVFMNDNVNRWSIPNGWLVDARGMLDLNTFKMLGSVLMGCTQNVWLQMNAFWIKMHDSAVTCHWSRMHPECLTWKLCAFQFWIVTGCTQNVWPENHWTHSESKCMIRYSVQDAPRMPDLRTMCAFKIFESGLVDAPKMFDLRINDMNAFKNVWIRSGTHGSTQNVWLENHERMAWFGSHTGCTQNAWPENHVYIWKHLNR